MKQEATTITLTDQDGVKTTVVVNLKRFGFVVVEHRTEDTMRKMVFFGPAASIFLPRDLPEGQRPLILQVIKSLRQGTLRPALEEIHRMNPEPTSPWGIRPQPKDQ